MSKPHESFVLYARGVRPGDEFPRIHVVTLKNAEVARSWLQCFAGNDLYPVGNLLEHGNFTVKCSRMAEIMDHGPTDHELDKQYQRWILQFKYGSWETVRVKTPELTNTADGPSSPAPKPPKPERVAKASVPPGYVKISELATTWGVSGMIARQALRVSGRTKPEYGWAFDPKEVPAIKKLVMGS